MFNATQVKSILSSAKLSTSTTLVYSEFSEITQINMVQEFAAKNSTNAVCTVTTTIDDCDSVIGDVNMPYKEVADLLNRLVLIKPDAKAGYTQMVEIKITTDSKEGK